MIGIDIIKIARMEHLIERFGDKALKRFLSQEEIEIINNPKSAAGFWAAKEAFSKALGSGIGSECSFFDIKIYKDHKGAPHFALSKRLIERHGIIETALSITHDGDYAIAVATLQTQSTPTNKIKQF